MTARSTALIASGLACLLAGCADGSLSSAFNTGSIDPQKQAANEQAAKSKQALCNTLVSQIDALNGEGISDKVAKAASKKYKLKPTDITKADELNKANTEFQSKCSDFPPRVAATAPIEPVAATATPAAGAAAAPVPTKTAAAKPKTAAPAAEKPVAAAMAPQDPTPTATAATDSIGTPNP